MILEHVSPLEEAKQNEHTSYDSDTLSTEKIGTDLNFKPPLAWRSIILLILYHVLGLYGLSLVLTFKVKFSTIVWTFLLDIACEEGVLMCAHRLYSHRAFKATFSLRLFLILIQTMAGQDTVYHWARDHRVHHKYSDTDADPHNATKGLFHSHIGWLLRRKHPLVKEKGNKIDLSDLEADSLIQFQRKWYFPLYFLVGVCFPVVVPVIFWGETIWNSLFVCYYLNYILVLHQTLTINSLAHAIGNKPYDKNIRPTENSFVSLVTGGEGWHNYHHTFPRDYRASEYGNNFMLTATLIEFFSKFGLAYDLKTVPDSMIVQRSARTGDGAPINTVSRIDDSTE